MQRETMPSTTPAPPRPWAHLQHTVYAWGSWDLLPQITRLTGAAAPGQIDRCTVPATLLPFPGGRCRLEAVVEEPGVYEVKGQGVHGNQIEHYLWVPGDERTAGTLEGFAAGVQQPLEEIAGEGGQPATAPESCAQQLLPVRVSAALAQAVASGPRPLTELRVRLRDETVTELIWCPPAIPPVEVPEVPCGLAACSADRAQWRPLVMRCGLPRALSAAVASAGAGLKLLNAWLAAGWLRVRAAAHQPPKEHRHQASGEEACGV